MGRKAPGGAAAEAGAGGPRVSLSCNLLVRTSPNGGVTTIPMGASTGFEVDGVGDGRYWVRAQAVASDGRVSLPSNEVLITIGNAPPAMEPCASDPPAGCAPVSAVET